MGRDGGVVHIKRGVKCASCDKTFHTPATAGRVRCTFCGAVNRVRR